MFLPLVKLATKSLRNRMTTASLTVISIALSVMLLLTVDTIRVQTKESFTQTLSGTDLIVGARSGSIQLLLYTVFRIGNATNNISWDSYEKIAAHPRVAWHVPMILGDSHKGYRVLGTNADYFEHYQYSNRKALVFSEGRGLEKLFDVVLGAEVARELNYVLGDEIILAHGTGNVSFAEHKDTPFRVSGILQATGTPVDKTVHISIQGFEAMHIGWESGVSTGANKMVSSLSIDDPSVQPETITAFLLGLKSKPDVFSIQRGINTYRGEALMAILPGVALHELWKVVSIAEQALLAVSIFVIAISLLGMLTLILTSLSERRREMSILRSVGASPKNVFVLLLLEAEILLFTGILLGIALTVAALSFAGAYIEQAMGLSLQLFSLSALQVIILLSVVIGGLMISLIPAWRAYRNTLQDGLTMRA